MAIMLFIPALEAVCRSLAE